MTPMMKTVIIILAACLSIATVPLASAKTTTNTVPNAVSLERPMGARVLSAPTAIRLAHAHKISASQAKSIARRAVPGAEVIDISFNGRAYRVRMQRKNGRVIDVFVDAVTGRIR